MNRMSLYALALLLGLGLVSATASDAAAVGSDEKARIKASNLLGFASEEIHVVMRDFDAGEMDNAAKSYRQAKKYHSKAFKQLEKASLSEEEKKAMEDFKRRVDELELHVESLTSAKVRDLVSLVDETRDYFKVSG
jgi:hypothetical protein